MYMTHGAACTGGDPTLSHQDQEDFSMMSFGRGELSQRTNWSFMLVTSHWIVLVLPEC